MELTTIDLNRIVQFFLSFQIKVPFKQHKLLLTNATNYQSELSYCSEVSKYLKLMR